MKKTLRRLTAFIVMLCVAVTALMPIASSALTVRVFVDRKITEEQRNSYYKNSAFIGSSIGVHQQTYFRTQKKGYLGNPLFLVKGCYAFHNDFGNNKPYMLTYNGVTYHAWDAIKVSGRKKVFINMGTNDLLVSAQNTYDNYVKYLKKIRNVNPDVLIFIEATPPMVNSSQMSVLNNANINKLNSLMKSYCKGQKDMWFVDVNTPLKNANGGLKNEYSSDGYVHINNKGYASWMKTLTAYTDDLMVKERVATKYVDTISQKINNKQYAFAKAAMPQADKEIAKLEKSSKKANLESRMVKLRKRYKRLTGQDP